MYYKFQQNALVGHNHSCSNGNKQNLYNSRFLINKTLDDLKSFIQLESRLR